MGFCSKDSLELLLANGRKEVNMKDPYWQTTAGLKKRNAAQTLEFSKLVNDKAALRPMSLAESRQVLQRQSQRVLDPRLVWTGDAGSSDSELKCRATVQGFRDPDLMRLAREGCTNSPTISQNGRAVALQLIASLKAELHIGDVTGAFLEAGALERPEGSLYLRQPKSGDTGLNLHPEQLLEIVKPLYGLNDAPARWWQKLSKYLTASGRTQDRMDECLFFMYDTETVISAPIQQNGHRLVGVIGWHVDDSVSGGHGKKYEKAVADLRKTFPFKRWKSQKGRFCGSELNQNSDFSITASQKEFSDSCRMPRLGTEPNWRMPLTTMRSKNSWI